ncbi:MAG: hypothetical protein ABIO94_06525, partial [Opitutaceae bacterium]
TVSFAEETMPRVLLPQMEVKASSEKREVWRYSKVAGWEVFSQVSDTRARSLLQSLRKFDFALRIVQPRLVAGPASALTIVFVNEDGYRTWVGSAATTHAPEFSTWVHRSGRSAIVVNTEAEFGMGDSAVAVNTGEDFATDNVASNPNTVDSYRQLNRQYVRHVLAAQSARLPAWLEEGLAQALIDVDYRADWVAYGKIETEKNMPSGGQPVPIAIDDFLAPNNAVAGLSFKQVFAHRRLMPLGAFFTARRTDGSAPSPDSAWAKQAYAFVHFCLFGNKLRYQEPMAKLAAHLKSEPMSEQLFQDCFGVDYAKMEKELSGYLDYTRHNFQRYPLKPDQRLNPEPINFREATHDEVEQLRRLEP